MPSPRGSLVGIAAEDHLDAQDLISSSQAVPGRDRRAHHLLRNYPMCSVARVSDEFTVSLCHTHHRETIAALMKYCGGGKPEWIRLRPPPHSGLQTIHVRERKPLAAHRLLPSNAHVVRCQSRPWDRELLTTIALRRLQRFR